MRPALQLRGDSHRWSPHLGSVAFGEQRHCDCFPGNLQAVEERHDCSPNRMQQLLKICYMMSPVVLVAVCSPELMSGDVPVLESSDIRHHTLLHNGTRPECWAVWLHKASVVGVDTTSGLVFDSFYLTVRAAIAGMGIAILPLPIAEEPLKRGHLVMPFEVRVTSGDSYSLLYLEHRSVLPKVQAFRDWLFREAESVSGDL